MLLTTWEYLFDGVILMDKSIIEYELAKLPILQYEFIKTEELMFSENVRHICKTECPMYGTTWACPPGVGSVEECKAKCLGFSDALLITTMAEVSDIANIEETLATRPEHEKIAHQVRDLLRSQGLETYVLSTEACTHCEKCTYPNAPCRHPDDMFPCTESHAIVVTDIAEKYGIEFISGNIVTWFSIIFYK
jgi:predicted metal-binding protein